jgi:hypothetical protein
VADLDRDSLAPARAHGSERRADDLAGLLPARFEPEKPSDREGLPPGYRMRADAHYVDQLSSRSGDVPMRLVPLDDIDAPDFDSSGDPVGFRALIESIAEHGVVQPLLVRRDGARYRLVAGRKRLAAARAASIARVPCLVHNVDAVEADALARAVDVHAVAWTPPASAAPGIGVSSTIHAPVVEALATIQSAATLVADDSSPLVRRVALDLIRSAAWRASWQLRAAAIVDGTHQWRVRSNSIGGLLARVRDGFAADGRLRGIDLTVTAGDWNVTVDVDDEALVAAIAGAVVATASLADTENGRVALRLHPAGASGLSIEISQPAAQPDTAIVRRFFDPSWIDRPGGRFVAMGAAAVRVVAAYHGGDATVMIDPDRGSSVRVYIAARTHTPEEGR